MSWVVAASLSAQPLLESHLRSLHQHRYVVVPDWMSAAQTDRLQCDAVAVDAHHGLDCMIGTTHTALLDHSIRRSRQSAFYPPPSNAAGSVATRDDLIGAVNTLRGELQNSALMALPTLGEFQTELNYLCYPDGGHYTRHLDQPYGDSGWVRQGRRAADGGSFCGARTRRVVSLILYLNRDWDAADGGALRLFQAHERGGGTAESHHAQHTEDVLPRGGTLVLLMSGEVEHLVRTTASPRQAVVGWFNECASARVPDLAARSTRTMHMLDAQTTSASCTALGDECAE